MHQSQASIQRDHSKQEKWPDGKLMHLNKGKCTFSSVKKSNSILSFIRPGTRSSREVTASLYASLGGTQLKWPPLPPFLCDHIADKRDL